MLGVFVRGPQRPRDNTGLWGDAVPIGRTTTWVQPEPKPTFFAEVRSEETGHGFILFREPRWDSTPTYLEVQQDHGSARANRRVVGVIGAGDLGALADKFSEFSHRYESDRTQSPLTTAAFPSIFDESYLDTTFNPLPYLSDLVCACRAWSVVRRAGVEWFPQMPQELRNKLQVVRNAVGPSADLFYRRAILPGAPRLPGGWVWV